MALAEREAEGRTREDLAAEIGVHVSNFSRWCNDGVRPRPGSWGKIERVLGIPLGTLAQLDRVDPMTPEVLHDQAERHQLELRNYLREILRRLPPDTA
jgi:transcriptional regulator with XRE-family HTH domain